MYGFNTHPNLFHQPGVSPNAQPHFRSNDVTMILRQQPKEALVTIEGKEKARKPVDPPPIIQLHVEPRADPAQHYLQSPYLFMCTSLYRGDRDEPWDGLANKSLAGSLVSSLHRLKDVDNKDGGFFVFGDISVKVQGTFRLHFSLFDLHKDSNEVQYLGSVTSEPFKVMLPKDFKGMDESTYLSRAFSDQGVRLRLRKEPRAMMGNKRSYPYGSDTPASNTPIRPNMPEYPYGDNVVSPNKRFRADTEDRKENFSDHNSVSGTGYPSSYSSAQYPVRQPSLSGTYSMGQYQTFGNLTAGSAASNPSYHFRAMANTSSTFYTDPLLPTSGALASQHRYPDVQHTYSQIIPAYRNPTTSSLSFSDDSTGLGSYRAASTLGLGDEQRPASTIGVSSGISITPQTQTSQPSSHSQSPEILRSGGFYTNRSGEIKRAVLHRTESSQDASQVDGHSSISSLPVYHNSRNAYQAPASEPNLTSHTDTGVMIPPLLPFNPDLNQSTEAHNASSG